MVYHTGKKIKEKDKERKLKNVYLAPAYKHISNINF